MTTKVRVIPQAGIEPATTGLKGQRSAELSYCGFVLFI